MTYLQFVLIFLVAPTAVLVALHGQTGVRRLLEIAAWIAVTAVLYATPWIRLLIERDIWGSSRARGTIADVPVETIIFFAAQAVFTTVLTAIALRRQWWRR